MEHKYIPKFMVTWTFYAWKFVAGAFGKKVERPWREQLCGPFWLSLLGVTAGLPVVLVAYVIKLLFGAGRAEKFGDALEKVFTSKVLKGIFGLILGLCAAYLLIGLVVLFVRQPAEMALATGILLGVFLLTLGIIKLLIFISEWRDESILEEVIFNNPTAAEKNIKIAKTIRGFALIVFLPLIIAWKITRFIGFMVYAGYKKFCPIVEYK